MLTKFYFRDYQCIFLSSNFTLCLENISQGVFCQEENISQKHRDYTECVTVLEEAWRRFKKPSATLSKHLSEKLLLLPVILCREDLKSISITERSCRELYNNHHQIWQNKVRILILQFISFDILSVISPFPHNLFIPRGRWHTTCSLDWWDSSFSFTFLPLSLFLFLSCLFVSLDSSGCFFHLSMLPLQLFQSRRKNPACFSLTQNTAAKRACDEDFVHVAHTKWGGPRVLLLLWLGCILSIRPNSAHFPFKEPERAFGELWSPREEKAGIHADSWVESTGLAVDVSARPCWPPGCPGEQAGQETCVAQKNLDLNDNIYTIRLFITSSVTSSWWLAEAAEA